MENYTEIEYRKAQKRVRAIKEFLLHLLIFVLANLMIIFFKVKGDGHIRISQFLTIVVWGAFLLFHFLKVIVPNIILGKKWEEKKIKELMNKKNNEHGN